MRYKEKLKTRRWFEYRAHILDEKGSECENCKSDFGCYVVPKGYVDGYEPWDYEVLQVRVLCEDCNLDVRNRCEEFTKFCDGLPGIALAHLLDGLDAFRELQSGHRTFAEDVY